MNLLPADIKTSIKREYRLRFIALLSVFIFFSTVVGLISSLPSVASVVVEYMPVRAESRAGTDVPVNADDKKLLADFQSFKEILGILDPEKAPPSIFFSELIRLVIADAPEQVKLKSLSFSLKGDLEKLLVFSGTADDRESLVEFSRRLENESVFSSVDLPISNLNKSRDIDFSMTATIKQNKPKTEADSEAKESLK